MAQGEEKTYNKNVLIAADETENARRAVSYVAQFLGGLPGFKVTLLHVVGEPEPDYFPTTAEREKWLSHYVQRVDGVLEEYRQILIQAGFDPNDVSIRTTLRYCPSMAECILEERDQTDYSTIVVGRRGISRLEEFLFGSISSKIVTHARNCSVWVVE